MKRRFIAIGFLCCAGIVAVVWWRLGHASVSPNDLLQMDDLTHTKVSYSWSGFFTFEGCVSDVSAEFQGDGSALLRLGDREPVEAKITPERYRELLQTMADNGFSTIAVKRRWGVYLADFGRVAVELKANGRQTVVYADEKHYVDAPERLQAIIEMIYSFEREFGQEFDCGPIATTGVRDYRDLAMAISGVAVVVLAFGGVLLLWYLRKGARARRRS